MIISIRGTSGAGKTTVAKRVLNDTGLYHPPVQVMDTDGKWTGVKRKNPLYYTRQSKMGFAPIAILGSYENTTGGVDTISGNDIPFDLARHLHSEGYDVFMEGLLLSAEQHRTAALHRDGIPVYLFYFNIPLQDCLNGVQARRESRGDTRPLNPKTTASRYSAIRTHPDRFRAQGINVVQGDRDAAITWLEDLGILDKKVSVAAE